MDIQKLNIEEVKIFSNLSSIVLAVWAGTFLLSLGIATFYLGHVPVYSVDNDPSSLNIFILDATKWINVFSFLFLFVAFLAWPLLFVHLLINKAAFTRTDKLMQLSALLSILFFFMFKYVWTDQFLWHND